MLLIAVVSWSGCSPQPKPIDPTALVLIPGVGISNVVELGMTTKQVKEKVAGVIVEPVGSKLYFSLFGEETWIRRPFSKPDFFVWAIPELGVSWFATNEDRSISYITITVDSKIASRLWEGGLPYKGQLDKIYSFTNAGRLSSEDIRKHFGEPLITIPPTQSNQSASVTQDTNKTTRPIHLRMKYVPQGIEFALHSNVLYSIVVTTNAPSVIQK